MLHHILSLHSLFIRFVCSHTHSVLRSYDRLLADSSAVYGHFLCLRTIQNKVYTVHTQFALAKIHTSMNLMFIHQCKCRCIRTTTDIYIYWRCIYKYIRHMRFWYLLISTAVLPVICLMLSTFNPSPFWTRTRARTSSVYKNIHSYNVLYTFALIHMWNVPTW